jgi:putative ABC transport system permease protein
LSDQSKQITSIVGRVDSVDHLAAATTAVQAALGDSADVTSSEETVKDAVEPLENIRTIATTSLIGALVASTIITLLTMVIVVRERRKEIAVLKAIGAGDATIVSQFMTESVVLSLLGSVVGTVLGIVFSNPVLAALVKSNASNGGPTLDGGPGGGPGRGAVTIAVGGFRAVRGAVENLTAAVDLHLILYGLLAALLVAILGSSFPAWLIAKIRPADVLRSE